MAKEKASGDASIIEIIQKMVSDGESEQKIIQTLQELGVEPDKAKRLLLLGQADTFALLRSEIAKIVSTQMEKEKAGMLSFAEEQASTASEKSKEKIEKAVMADIRQYERDITGQSRTYQEQISDTVQRMAELSEKVRAKLNELGEAVQETQADMDELKVKGVGSRNVWISRLLLVLGIAFCLSDLYLFFTVFQGIFSVDTLILTIIMALIGITMLFVATIV
ncbi:MAG: hypothetical protein V1494_01985 [Candidatus Diapherotrites archaeon]